MTEKPLDGPRRVVIERVTPQIDGGRFAVKRIVGDAIIVEADVFADGHDLVACEVVWRKQGEKAWKSAPMASLGMDRWRGTFSPFEIGRFEYSIRGWIARFDTWRRDLRKRVEARQDVGVDLLAGALLLDDSASAAEGSDRQAIGDSANYLRSDVAVELRIAAALDQDLLARVDRNPDRRHATTYERTLEVIVDPPIAGCSAWYEFFPRSTGAFQDVHGTFADCEARLEYAAAMGFDVVYLPPIHPIGTRFRKGKNNAVTADADDVGSPWAIGAKEGGHSAIHPKLGTLDDFRRLVAKATSLNLWLALDVAFQCAPDHPYVTEHPEWFKARPDGTIQYAENPPKKYQDIYPFDFESEDWRAMWDELKSVILFWIEEGVKIFRVDNPHTKAFGFWEWLIAEVKRDHPEIVFLAEAFTRPSVMLRLAKLGFTQSYTYFTWRNSKHELTSYFGQLGKDEWREAFRPNVWPNTPDILPEFLQTGGRPAFVTRLILAATLGANYGIYGPPFELQEHAPREHGSEEYLHSEKYQLRSWDIDRPDSLRSLIARVNQIRRENSALHRDDTLEFHSTDNDQIICFSKRAADGSNAILVVMNLDPWHEHSGWIDVPLEKFGVAEERSFQVHDLLTEGRYLWHGPRNYVLLNPQNLPAHIFRIRRRIRTENDFEYFL